MKKILAGAVLATAFIGGTMDAGAADPPPPPAPPAPNRPLPPDYVAQGGGQTYQIAKEAAGDAAAQNAFDQGLRRSANRLSNVLGLGNLNAYLPEGYVIEEFIYEITLAGAPVTYRITAAEINAAHAAVQAAQPAQRAEVADRYLEPFLNKLDAAKKTLGDKKSGSRGVQRTAALDYLTTTTDVKRDSAIAVNDLCGKYAEINLAVREGRTTLAQSLVDKAAAVQQASVTIQAEIAQVAALGAGINVAGRAKKFVEAMQRDKGALSDLLNSLAFLTTLITNDIAMITTLLQDVNDMRDGLVALYKNLVLLVYYRQKSGAGAPNIAIQYRAVGVDNVLRGVPAHIQYRMYTGLNDPAFAQRIVDASYGDTINDIRNVIPAGVAVGADERTVTFTAAYTVGANGVPAGGNAAKIPLPPALRHP